jgi:hypothetical protein
MSLYPNPDWIAEHHGDHVFEEGGDIDEQEVPEIPDAPDITVCWLQETSLGLSHHR